MQGSSNWQAHDEDCRKEQLKYEHSSRSFRRNESQWAIAEQCAGCRNYRHLESRKGSSQAPEVERVENNDWRDQKEKWIRGLRKDKQSQGCSEEREQYPLCRLRRPRFRAVFKPIEENQQCWG